MTTIQVICNSSFGGYKVIVWDQPMTKMIAEIYCANDVTLDAVLHALIKGI